MRPPANFADTVTRREPGHRRRHRREHPVGAVERRGGTGASAVVAARRCRHCCRTPRAPDSTRPRPSPTIACFRHDRAPSIDGDGARRTASLRGPYRRVASREPTDPRRPRAAVPESPGAGTSASRASGMPTSGRTVGSPATRCGSRSRPLVVILTVDPCRARRPAPSARSTTFLTEPSRRARRRVPRRVRASGRSGASDWSSARRIAARRVPARRHARGRRGSSRGSSHAPSGFVHERARPVLRARQGLRRRPTRARIPPCTSRSSPR